MLDGRLMLHGARPVKGERYGDTAATRRSIEEAALRGDAKAAVYLGSLYSMVLIADASDSTAPGESAE